MHPSWGDLKTGLPQTAANQAYFAYLIYPHEEKRGGVGWCARCVALYIFWKNAAQTNPPVRAKNNYMGHIAMAMILSPHFLLLTDIVAMKPPQNCYFYYGQKILMQGSCSIVHLHNVSVMTTTHTNRTLPAVGVRRNPAVRYLDGLQRHCLAF